MDTIIIKLKNEEEFTVNGVDFNKLVDYISDLDYNGDRKLCFYNLVVSLTDILYIRKEEEE